MRKNLCAYSLLVVLFFNVIPSCFGEDASLDSQINAYDRRDYKEAIRCGVAVIKQDPDNCIAHYYLANSYCKLKQFNDAIPEYSACLKLENESPIAQYSRQALIALNRSGKKQPKSDIGVKDLKTKYAQEQQADLDRAQSDADALVKEIRQRANADVDAIPRTFTNPGAYIAQNANLPGDVDAIRQKEEARVKDVYDQLSKQQDSIKQTYKKKINGLNVPASAGKGKDAYQFNSDDSNLYVRNYNQSKLPRPPVVKASKTNSANMSSTTSN